MKIYKKWQIPLRDGGGVGGGGLIIDIMYSNAPNNVLSCAYVVKYSFPDRERIKGHPVKSLKKGATGMKKDWCNFPILKKRFYIII